MKDILDLSKWNIVQDYSKAAKEIEAVFIRCGYRRYATGKLTEDSSFKTHINGFVVQNTTVGVYFFTTAITPEEAQEEARFVAKLIKPYNISLPIFVDSEMSNKNKDGRSDNLDKEIRTNCIVAFCEEIERLGYAAGVYASDTWLVSMLDYDKIKKYKIWNARYGGKPEKVTNNTGWQYTSNGSISGINKRVDLSHWYEDFTKKEIPNVPVVKPPIVNPPVVKPATNTIASGSKLKLSSTPLYSRSTSTKVAAKKTGTFYIWSNIIKGNKVRITNKPENVGNALRITGWISVEDASNSLA